MSVSRVGLTSALPEPTLDLDWILHNQKNGLVPFAPFYGLVTLVLSLVLFSCGCLPSSVTTSAALFFSLVVAAMRVSKTILTLIGTILALAARAFSWLQCGGGCAGGCYEEELRQAAFWSTQKSLFWAWLRSLPHMAVSAVLGWPVALWTALSALWLSCPWREVMSAAGCSTVILFAMLRPHAALWIILSALWVIGRVGFEVITEIWKVPLWAIIITIDTIEVLEPYFWISFWLAVSFLEELCSVAGAFCKTGPATQGPPDLLREWRRDDGSIAWWVPNAIFNKNAIGHDQIVAQLIQEESVRLWAGW